MVRTENTLWRLCGITPRDMDWRRYLLAILAFNLLGIALLFILLLAQGSLPLNPQGFPGLRWDLALNTAVSFVTNTNWQAYSGESSLSYLSQMAGLGVQNFLSAASGIAILFALTRAFSRHADAALGNAWVDLWRITLYVLLPLSLLLALFFAGQGVVQNFAAYVDVSPLEGGKTAVTAGAGRLPRGDQTAGHQRRRFLRCQLRPSLRKPQRAEQSGSDGGDFPATQRTLLRLRPQRRR